MKRWDATFNSPRTLTNVTLDSGASLFLRVKKFPPRPATLMIGWDADLEPSPHPNILLPYRNIWEKTIWLPSLHQLMNVVGPTLVNRPCHDARLRERMERRKEIKNERKERGKRRISNTKRNQIETGKRVWRKEVAKRSDDVVVWKMMSSHFEKRTGRGRWVGWRGEKSGWRK